MHFPATEFSSRQRALAEIMEPESALVLVAPPYRLRSHDTTYRYRSSSDILYLSGFSESQVVLVFRPDSQAPLTLFVAPKDREREQWDGHRTGPQGVLEHEHIDQAFEIDQVDELLPQLLEDIRTLYYSFLIEEDFDARMLDLLKSMRQRRGKPPTGPQVIHDAQQLLHPLRLKKSGAEMELMRQSGAISARAHTMAMKAAGTFTHEHQLQALIEYEFARSGADFPAYSSIVGSGKNATILHYISNQEPLDPSSLVLVDAGCEWKGYASDITRTWPVGGIFSGAQRDLYQAVLEIQESLLHEIRPGRTFTELAKLCQDKTIQALMDLGALGRASLEEHAERGDYKRFMPHGFGHWLGIDVHDVGGYYDREGPRVLEEGFALTVEPGIYFLAEDETAPEAFRGLGVRIEDDVLLGPKGCENITADCPKGIDELEAIIGSGLTLAL